MVIGIDRWRERKQDTHTRQPIEKPQINRKAGNRLAEEIDERDIDIQSGIRERELCSD